MNEFHRWNYKTEWSRVDEADGIVKRTLGNRGKIGVTSLANVINLLSVRHMVWIPLQADLDFRRNGFHRRREIICLNCL